MTGAGYELKDSGQREAQITGAVRDSRANKGRYDLATPIGLRRVSLVWERGAQKYAPRNWEKGMAMSRYLDSALRHIEQYISGVRDEDHLAQGAWNILAAMHEEEMIARGLHPSELYDVPNYFGVGKPAFSPEVQCIHVKLLKDCEECRQK